MHSDQSVHSQMTGTRQWAKWGLNILSTIVQAHETKM